MKPVITLAQQLEVCELAKEHGDALVAYGADLYRRGLFRGTIIGAAGVLIGIAIYSAINSKTTKINSKKAKVRG